MTGSLKLRSLTMVKCSTTTDPFRPGMSCPCWWVVVTAHGFNSWEHSAAFIAAIHGGVASFRGDISGYPVPSVCPQYEKPSNHQWCNPVTLAIASNNFQHPKSQLGFMAADAQQSTSTSGKVTRREKGFFVNKSALKTQLACSTSGSDSFAFHS